MQVIPIISSGPLSVETNALLDCGSATASLRKNIAKRLNLEGSQQQLTVTSALSKSDKIDSSIVSVNVSSLAMKDSSKLSAWLVNNLDILLHKELRVGRDGEPMAVKTKLDWVLMGESKYNIRKGLCNFLCNNSISTIDQSV